MTTGPDSRDRQHKAQRGQSLILVTFVLMALMIFVIATVDISSAYYHRRMAQNAADAAVLAAAEELAANIDADPGTSTTDRLVRIKMNDFAQRNDIEDTDDDPTNDVNNNVLGYYLDENGNPITDYPIGEWPYQPSADNLFGVEATAYITAPSFFGGLLGIRSYPLQAEAAVQFEKSCSDDCVLPIAMDVDTFNEAGIEPGTCYNFWDGGGGDNFGWLNWSHNVAKYAASAEYTCRDAIGVSDCDVRCLHHNLNPDYCAGWVAVDDYVAGTSGIKTDEGSKGNLYRIITEGILGTIIVYDEVSFGNGECGQYFIQDSGAWNFNGGMLYHVGGFATFRFTGFRLTTGHGPYNPADQTGVLFDLRDAEGNLVADPETCINVGTPGDLYENSDEINRITGILMPRDVGGTTGRCTPTGFVYAPRLSR